MRVRRGEMSCKFYTFRQGDYYCIKKEDYVDSDWYYKYCRNYDYDDCPIYKDEPSGGCYLTSACIESKGLPDDCYELETLRQYRDTWLKSSEKGEAVIKQYYEIAPKIVSAINETEDSKSIYETIYEKMVKPCVTLIQQKKYQEAFELYCNITLQLEKEYCL
jgi:hypothetical protein